MSFVDILAPTRAKLRPKPPPPPLGERTSTAIDYFYCGCFGGLCTTLVGHPFDTVKVRMQTARVATSALLTVQHLMYTGGLLGFYRGLSAPIATVVPIFGISFMGYKVGKSGVAYLRSRRPCDFTAVDFVLSGAFSGTFTTFVTAPGEHVKCLLQVQQSAGPKVPRKTAVVIIKDLYKENGLQSIYRGAGATLARDIPASAVFFTTYEMMLKFFTYQVGLEHCHPNTHMLSMLSGGFAGVAFWIVGLPADVLKSRLQTAQPGMYPNGLSDALRHLLVTDGPAALYRGIVPVMLRAFPANAACFFGYEAMRTFIYYVKDIKKCGKKVWT